MQKIKKLLNVALIIIMVTSMVACGTESAESLDELIALGAQYLLDGNYSEAVVAFDKAIKIDEKSIVAYVGLGDANLGLEDYEKAGADYEKAIEIDNQTVEAYIGRADAYLFENDEESAITVLNEGYETTGNAKLNSIVEEIYAGTYAPTVLHMDWESLRDTAKNNADTNGDDEVCIAKWIDYLDSNYEPVKGEGYDASGNLVETKTLKEGETDLNGLRYITYYDEDGNIIKEEQCASDGTLQWYTIYKYGTGEYPIEGETYWDGRDVGTIYYDANFKPVKGKDINFIQVGDGPYEVVGYSIHYYDEEGNITKTENYDLDGKLIDIQ